MSETTNTNEIDINQKWLDACPDGQARTFEIEGTKWAVDRRMIGVTLEGGASAVQTVCVTDGRAVRIESSEDACSDPLVAIFAALQTLAPSSSNGAAYEQFQSSVRKLLDTHARTTPIST